MLNGKTLLGFIAAFQLLLLQNTHGAKSIYQVTGPIVEITDKVIVVQKGEERWSIARDQDTQVKGDLKVGDKVTVQYRMTATSIESKSTSQEPKKKSK